MKLTILGTGNATVTECYNTCFVISNKENHFMIDGGGGNMILHQLKSAGFDWKEMRDIFVTHKHIDHLLGIIWMMRMILQNMNRGTYDGEATIYGHEEVIAILEKIAGEVLSEKETKKSLMIEVPVPERPAGQKDVVNLVTPKLDTVRVGFIGLGTVSYTHLTLPTKLEV